ncbi:hydroxyacyl glutathione hydrolase [Gonapodya prolifera JEL478]|uniref:hydroxyacylglutathione hydrolase n=1 Tax=Gonapodya prolifera (strain JEL478) TaxID=1344416 RepID=A0A139A1B0_GONPJ|nr:hydroxyacyl glutathione hydrolase [Gonapodya prolifera JEL478]|eukprot:KXS10408.1 hydroxyacyl glutathione hydrolase [Gonapodya prolifera JEL478]
MKVVPVPCLEDNYAYLLIDEKTGTSAFVDPVQPEKLVAAAEKEGVKASIGLTTHHHYDHAGGNEKLASLVPGVRIYGSDDRIPALTNSVSHNDTFKIGSLTVTVLHTPCHTSGHICYYVVGEDGQKAVFTGDTLFIGGCGRFFEGTASEMVKNLTETLGKLPGETKVWCGHEYTKSNLLFARHIEPTNSAILSRLERIKANPTEQTVPSTIAEEHLLNPFVRCALPQVIERVGTPAGDVVASMAKLREMKNGFKNPAL